MGPEEGNGGRLWSDACDFYRHQLRRSLEAQSYLRSRGIESPAVVDRMRIGYAPGGCLRAYLQDLGYTRAAMVSSGLIDAQGRGRLWQAITFPIAETVWMSRCSRAGRNCALSRSAAYGLSARTATSRRGREPRETWSPSGRPM